MINKKVLDQLKGVDRVIYILGVEGPLRFNRLKDDFKVPRSSLSRYLKDGSDNLSYLTKDENKWGLTSKGRTRYSAILKENRMDPETLIEADRKNLLREIDKIKKFFKMFEIENEEIRYYYKKLYLNINFEHVKKHVKESFFNLLIYYIVQKHPKFYNKATLNLPQFTEKYIGKGEEFLKILQNSIIYFIKDESFPRLFKIEIQIEEKILDLYLTEDDPIIKTVYIEIDLVLNQTFLDNLEAGYSLIDVAQKKKVVENIKNKLVTKRIIDYYILNSGFLNQLINDRIRTTFQQLPPVFTEKTKLKSTYFMSLAGYESCKQIGILPIYMENYDKIEEVEKKLASLQKEIPQDSFNDQFYAYEKRLEFDYDEELALDDYIMLSAHLCDNMHEFEEAYNVVQKGLKEYTKSHVLLINKAIILMKSGKLEEALEAIQAADKRFDKNFSKEDENYNYIKIEILARYVLILYELGNYEEAISINKRALALDPKDIFLNKYYALNLIPLEKEQEAMKYLEIVLAEEPEDIETLVNLAICKTNTKKFNEALPLIEKILSLNPPIEDKLFLLSMKVAVTIFKEIDIKEALKIIDSSDLKNYPESTINAYIWHGLVLIQEKKYEKALLSFETSIKLLKSLDLEYEYEVDGKSLLDNLDLLRENAQKERKTSLIEKIDLLKSELLTFKENIWMLRIKK